VQGSHVIYTTVITWNNSGLGGYIMKSEKNNFGSKLHPLCPYLAQNADKVTPLEGQFVWLVTMAIP
jgi:hypothetical protein